MVTGPQQQRLDRALTGASSEAVYGGSQEWSRCANLLSMVSRALEQASVTGQSLGGKTGPAVSAAFADTAHRMGGKTHDLNRGSEALAVAANALVAARVGESEMNRYHPQKPHPGSYTPPPGPLDHQDLLDQQEHQQGVNDYQTSFDTRENIARQLVDRIDTDFQASTETMKSIHGEPDPPADDDTTTTGPKQITVAPPSGERAPSGVVTAPTGVKSDPTHDTHNTHDPDVPTHHDPTTTTTTVPVPTHHSDPPTTTPFPGGGDALPYPGATGTTGTSGGIPGPLAGGLGVVAGGGLAGAAIGGLRGGLVPTGSVPGAAARPIGASGRAGAPGALGRGGASGTGSPTSRPTGRGAGARGGVRGGGRGAASAGGGAGGRRSGSGTGAGAGRRGGKDQDEHGRDRDLFDDGDDWLDDAEAAPGVID